MNNKELAAMKHALESVKWIANQKTGGMIERKAKEAFIELTAINKHQFAECNPKGHYDDGWNDAMRSVENANSQMTTRNTNYRNGGKK